MPYDEADLQWLREARYNVYALNGKQTKLQQEQKQITTELNQLFKADAKAAKKWARKLKGPVKDLGAADAMRMLLAIARMPKQKSRPSKARV